MKWFAECRIIMFFMMLLTTHLVAGEKALYKDPSANPEARASDLLSHMTLEEKIARLSGCGIGDSEFGDLTANIFGVGANERLGIPLLVMGHGITGVRSGRDSNVHSTYMMAPAGIGSSWNPELYARASAAVAKEMRALHQHLNLGTTLNIIRHPLGGRNWESFSEDPYLTARLAVANSRAMQENGIISGPKHFVANNQEHNRFDINNEVDERTLREIYLPGFKAAVVEGGALNIMGAYNRVNGTYMCEHKWLLDGVLRKEWGFKGFTLSDFGAGVRSIDHSINAGMNIEMHSPKYYKTEKVLAAIEQGLVTEARIEELVYEQLRVMFAMGIFEDAHAQPADIVHCAEHQKLALDMARQAPVLLKNTAKILPLNSKKLKSLAVIGPNARRTGEFKDGHPYFLQGGGSGRCYYFPDAVNDPFDEIQKLLPNVSLKYALGSYAWRNEGKFKDNLADAQKRWAEEDVRLVADAVRVAKESDAVVLMVGQNGSIESEGRDRKSAELLSAQNELIKKVAAVNDNVVVVMVSGSYVDVSSWVELVEGILYVPYCGEKLGQAVAEVLVGAQNPGGKLPYTYPLSTDDYPEGSIYTGRRYSQGKTSNVYSEGIFVGYRYFDSNNKAVLYPFGYGLSYTDFTISNLRVVTQNPVTVELTVANTGFCAGDEVVQVYVHDKKASQPRPEQELKGFQRVHVLPGKTKTVRIELDEHALAFWHPDHKDWIVEPGEFEIRVGSSSRMISGTKTISIP